MLIINADYRLIRQVLINLLSNAIKFSPSGSKIEIMARITEEKEIEIVFEAPEDFPSIEADRRAFMQIVLNILSNAVKFTTEGGEVMIRVWKDIQHSSSGIQICSVSQPFLNLRNRIRNFYCHFN